MIKLRDNMSYSIFTSFETYYYVDIFVPLGSCVDTKRFNTLDAAHDYLKANYVKANYQIM